MRYAALLLAPLAACATTAPEVHLDPSLAGRRLTLSVAPFGAEVGDAELPPELAELHATLVARLAAGGHTVAEGDDAALVLETTLVVREAEFSGSTARWDGTWQAIEIQVKRIDTGQPERFINVYQGTLPALSLLVRIRDASGRVLYESAGGIQVLSKRRGGDFEDVSPDEILADRERNRRAVDLALAGLLDG